MEHIYFLYQIRPTNTEQNLDDYYIGISNNPNRRYAEHLRYAVRDGKNKKMYQHVLEHGEDSISMFIVAHGTKKEMCTLENQLRPAPYIGWNTSTGGDVLRKEIVITDARREKMREVGRAGKGRKNPASQHRREATSNAMRKSLYHTPAGTFTGRVEAGLANGVSRDTVTKRCADPKFTEWTRTQRKP